MEKITIIGSPGAGKSRLARKLGSIFHIRVYHLDRIFHRRDWENKPRETRIDILQDLVRERRWIIDGTYFNTSILHLEMADTIIFLGISPFACLWRIMKRHLTFDESPRRDIPMGSTDKLTVALILKLLIFPIGGRRKLQQKLQSYESKQIFWLKSPKEVEDFLAQREPHNGAESQLSKRHLTTEKDKYHNNYKLISTRQSKETLYDNVSTPRSENSHQWDADVLRASRTRRATGVITRFHRLKQRLVAVL